MTALVPSASPAMTFTTTRPSSLVAEGILLLGISW
jgi:hypothetical protein